MALRTRAIKIAPGSAVLNSTVLVAEAAKQAQSHLNNLNFLRFIAAGMVWYGHSFAIKQVPEPLFLGAVPIGPVGVWIFFAIPIVALGFGRVSHPLGRLFAKHDYSYGIYINAFPVQQAVMVLYPGLSMLGYLAVTGSVILLLAALSWHWVEQPFLRFKPAAMPR
jgi:peptidoglycan/LPS O-acetylase OafA/YrhL